MPAVPNPLLQQYMKLTEFLGIALGPDYEVALHDLTNRDRSIIAIANNHISGREIGAPLTNMALGILRDRSYEHSDYCLQYHGVSVNGKDLRSNTFFIKQDGRLIGMLCINFDDSRYRELSDRLLSLCHPDLFLANVLPKPGVPEAAEDHPAPEKFRNSSDAVTVDAVNRELDRMGVVAERLTPEERLKVIAALEASGTFLLKGAVKSAAISLHCSQASIYRYLSQVKKQEGGTV